VNKKKLLRKNFRGWFGCTFM